MGLALPPQPPIAPKFSSSIERENGPCSLPLQPPIVPSFALGNSTLWPPSPLQPHQSSPSPPQHRECSSSIKRKNGPCVTSPATYRPNFSFSKKNPSLSPLKPHPSSPSPPFWNPKQRPSLPHLSSHPTFPSPLSKKYPRPSPLQPPDALRVQVIRRLVQQQDVGGGEQQSGEGHPPPLPPAEHSHQRVGGRATQRLHRLVHRAVDLPPVDRVDLGLRGGQDRREKNGGRMEGEWRENGGRAGESHEARQKGGVGWYGWVRCQGGGGVRVVVVVVVGV